MYGKLAMTYLKYQAYLCWFGSHHIFKCFPLGGNRTRTMSHQTAPSPNYRQPSPISVWQHNLHPFGRELYSSMVKLPYLCEKARGKPVWLRNHHI